MEFLYESFDAIDKLGALPQRNFNVIEDNISKKFPIRDYQLKSFSRFDYFLSKDFPDKTPEPFHLLFNMATGSGKTMVMAGLILYLYSKGYKNFLFFVHNNTILDKTKSNFLDKSSSKYLFNQDIVVGGKKVYIKAVNSFDEADEENINIHFTSIQKLHSDLVVSQRENGLEMDDFKTKRIVLLGDEAHHYNANSKSQLELYKSWEQLISNLHQSNPKNILLEFTATHDYENKDLIAKYRNKVIYKYDLKQFRKDKYSKEISLIRSFYSEQERILQALILNLYRQEIASQHHINLKPVVLFKAKKTVKESEQNKIKFHELIDILSEAMIDEIRNTSTIGIVQKAFAFFEGRKTSSAQIVNRLKSYFKPENCISANNDDEAQQNQFLLNSLEDGNNPIRAVFAVQKLNEGWDVLNLFDIVRLYEGQNSGGSNKKVGATTLSEAQLIGRGARYFPFVAESGQDKFTRKYDDALHNDLKVLEELFYHTKEDSRYISELKKALEETGLYDDEDKYTTQKLTLKESFKKSDFYINGQVMINKKVPVTFDHVHPFQKLSLKHSNYKHILSSGYGKVSKAFTDAEEDPDTLFPKPVKISDIRKHIVQYALSMEPFFYFNNLECIFPGLTSLSEFISSEHYLGGLEITFMGPKERLDTISNDDYLKGLIKLLEAMETEVKTNLNEFTSSPFYGKPVHQVFVEKEIRIQKDNSRSNEQDLPNINEPWFVYTRMYGTSEEKAFVSMFSGYFEQLSQKFEDIFLIRNERMFKIFDEHGQAFEPDYILHCKQKSGSQLEYQVFIEPKGLHLAPYDQWKNTFLKQIRDNSKINLNIGKYRVTAVPFYHQAEENAFKANLDRELVA